MQWSVLISNLVVLFIFCLIQYTHKTLTLDEIISIVNGVSLHTAFHYRPNIVLILLKYY